jgi:hypothetical protein
MRKRRNARVWMQQVKPHTYEEVLELMYTDKSTHGDPFSRPGNSTSEEIFLFFEGLKKSIVSWDGTVNSVSRLLERWSAFATLGAFKPEFEGADVSDYARAHLDPDFILERHLYVHCGMPATMTTLAMASKQSPFSDFMRIEEFWRIKDQWLHTEADLGMLNFGYMCLLLCYLFTCWVENKASQIPIIGPLWKLMTALEGLTGEAYANLNALYFGMFGCSSTTLSSLIPKDRKGLQKWWAINLWGKFTHMLPDIPEFQCEPLKELVDQNLGLMGMVHNLTLKGGWWVLAPVEDKPTATKVQTGGWQALDHADSVEACREVMSRGKVPIVTSGTGAGKSTDFIVSLKESFNTVYLSMPRTILVENNPVVDQKVYAGSPQKLLAGKINGVTHGYLRLALSRLDPGDILCLDEFHEMDEDSLALLEQHQGKVICIYATPPKYRADLFEQVHLTKSRNSGWRVQETLERKAGNLVDQIMLKIRLNPKDKILAIVPSYKTCIKLQKAMERQMPGVPTDVVWKGNKHPDPSARVYFGTSVVDAGITIPDCTLVIDSGLSVGRKNGVFGTFPSSKATSEQRRGRTGRTCHGRYIRLGMLFDETKFDFSTTFAANHKALAQQYGERRDFPDMVEVVPFLPGLYNEFVMRSDFSAVVFWYCLVTSLGKLEDAKTLYKNIKSRPLDDEWGFVMEAYGNPALQEIDAVLKRLHHWRSPMGGNNINPTNGRVEYLPLIDSRGAAEIAVQKGVMGFRSELVKA